MREKRWSIFVRVCFFEGSRNRGSVAKLENRGSLISVEASAEATPLGVFCLGIVCCRGSVDQGVEIQNHFLSAKAVWF
jgi:hypothetical protein